MLFVNYYLIFTFKLYIILLVMIKVIKKICIILSVIFTLPLITFSWGCEQNAPDDLYYSKSMLYFGSPISIVTKGEIPSEIFNQIATTVNALDKEFSVKSGTFTTAFNNADKNQPIPLSPSGKRILEACFETYNYTSKKFNPAIFPLVKLWGFTPDFSGQFIPPSLESINQILASNQTEFFNVYIEGQYAYKTNANTQLDFGGILKGFATEYIADTLYDNGFTSGYVSIGSSSIKILNSKTLAIRHPIKSGKHILEINCKDTPNLSVSTSGTYEKTHTHNGVTYSHIIDGVSGLPTNNSGVISATITGISGLYSDPFTTALILSDYSPKLKSGELIDFCNKIIIDYPNAKFYIVFNDGEHKQIITNEKESDKLTLLDSDYSIVEI